MEKNNKIVRVFLTKPLPILFCLELKMRFIRRTKLVKSFIRVEFFGNFDLEEPLTAEYYGCAKNNFVDVVFTRDSGRS